MSHAWNSTLPVRRERPRRAPQTPEKGEGASILHPGPLRSQALRDLAAKCPKYMFCGQPNDGSIVACHSNSQRHGKGMGLKAHDVPAYLCRECHDRLDGRAGSLTRHERDCMYLEAAWETELWLLESGHLKVVA